MSAYAHGTVVSLCEDSDTDESTFILAEIPQILWVYYGSEIIREGDHVALLVGSLDGDEDSYIYRVESLVRTLVEPPGAPYVWVDHMYAQHALGLHAIHPGRYPLAEA